jgi:integrase
MALAYSKGMCDEKTFAWESIVDDELAELVWRSAADNNASSTAQRDASALRMMLHYCRKAKLISYEEYRLACSFEAHGGTETAPAGHYLSEPDVLKIVSTAENGTGGVHTRIRDVALLLTLASSGARAEELLSVDLDQAFLHERRLTLVGKGRRARDVWLHPVAVDALRRWLEIRGDAPGALFVPLGRTGRPLHGRRLGYHQAWKIVKTRAAQAGLPGIAPHDMRRFVVSTLLRHVDLVLVAKVVGHKSPTTTARYDRRPAEEARDAVATLHLPSLGDLANLTA